MSSEGKRSMNPCPTCGQELSAEDDALGAAAEVERLREALEEIARINEREEMTFGGRLDNVERIARAALADEEAS